MEPNGTTTLSELPNPNQHSGLNNISMNTSEINQNNQNNINQNNMNQQNTIETNSQNHIINQQNNQNNYNELIGQLQNASSKGSTQLPSKHIPMVNNNNDPAATNNYIPQSNEGDYIQNEINHNDIIQKDNQKTSHLLSFENLYNEIQIPSIIGIVYYIFQLPYFRKSLYKILPILFNKDSNLNNKGIAFNAITFSIVCYILNKSITILANK